MEADLAHDGKEGHADRPLRDASAHRRAGRGVGRQLRADGLRRRRGDGRAGARRARLRVRDEIRPADQAGDRRRRQGVLERRAGSRGTPSTACCVNSGKYDGLDYEAAVDAIAADLKAKGLGEKQVTLSPARLGHLAPALLGLRRSRSSIAQHAATCRCPTISCRSCCPKTACRTAPAIRSRSARLRQQRAARSAARAAQRETDTMDTFVDSSWYFMRYAAPTSRTRWSTSACDYWLPVDQYIGGIEHAILHLLYSRFWTKVDARPGLVQHRRAVHEPAHAGHGAQRDLLPRRRRRPAIVYTTRPTSS